MNRTLRKPIVAGNWKMNTTLHECQHLVEGILGNESVKHSAADILLIPPFTHILEVVRAVVAQEEVSNVEVGAQNCHAQSHGAFTGEISAPILQSLGAGWCLVGHSERRQYFAETEELLAQKVNAFLGQDIKPIYCFGETKEERENGSYWDVVKAQVQKGVFHLSPEQFSNVVLAYEPVWAIGTGLTASSDQAQEMHAFVRGLVMEKYGESVAERTRILYGGSVKPNNAQELFEMPDIDGGLIGGASLVAADFMAIVAAAGQTELA